METQNGVEGSMAFSVLKEMVLVEDVQEQLLRKDAQIEGLNIQLVKERSKEINLFNDLKEELRRKDVQIKALNIQLDKERSTSKEMILAKYLKEELQRKDDRIKELNSQLDQEYSKYNVLLARMEKQQLKKSIKIQNQRDEIEWVNKTNDELIKLVKELRDKNKSLYEKVDYLTSTYGKNGLVAETTNKELNTSLYNCPSSLKTSSETEKLEIRFESFQSLRNDLIKKANSLEPKRTKLPEKIPLLIELDDSLDEIDVTSEMPKASDNGNFPMKLSVSDFTKDNSLKKMRNVTIESIIAPQTVPDFNKEESEISTNYSETAPLITSGTNALEQSAAKVLYIDGKRSVLKPRNGNSPYYTYTCIPSSSSIPISSISTKQPTTSISSSLLASGLNNLFRKDNPQSDPTPKKGNLPSEHTTSKPIFSIPTKMTASKIRSFLSSTLNTCEESVPKVLRMDLNMENRKSLTYTDKESGGLKDSCFIKSKSQGTRLRPFKCDVCECVFAQKIHLTTHRQKHSLKKTPKKDIFAALEMKSEKLDFHYQKLTQMSVKDKVKLETRPDSFETALPSSCDEITTEFILPDKDVSIYSGFKYFPTSNSERNDPIPVLEPDEDDDIDVGSEVAPECCASNSVNLSDHVQCLEVPNGDVFVVRNNTLANELMETTIKDMTLTMMKGSGIRKAKKRIIHEQKHAVKKPFKCDKCNSVFSQKRRFNIHHRQHMDEKPFKCDICDYSTKRKAHLTRHRNKHFDERPFQCDLCSNTFRQKINLVVHRRVHTGERPYKCTRCSYASADGSGLIKHKKKHCNDKPFKSDFASLRPRKKNILKSI